MTFNKYIAAAGLAVMLLGAQGCDKDGDTIYTDGPDRAEVSGVASDIVLDKDHLQSLALTIYWNENGKISLSDPLVAAPEGAASNTVQFSADPEFVSVVDDNMESGVY